ncbi:MAG TPA: MmcQ/YjbR family DNA-binding protein [Terriglobia bacterium]|nr:MmcQ/YjbR family DNA-binding protein [Terriglobia bacterium]
MAKTDAALARIRKICLALPDTKETMTWGKPHFRVGEKIFAGYGEENGKRTVGFKLEMAHANLAVQVPGFSRAPYVGDKGWVSLETDSVSDWEDVREMILESYRLIAPKRSLAQLDVGAPSSGKDTEKARRGAAASRKLSKPRHRNRS